MRILVTNDDGVLAPGLKIAEEIAAEIAGPEGEVWVAAPESERSGVSHCVSYASAVRVQKLGPRRFAVDGYPADCALIGASGLMDGPPDLILSGVNAGHNVAEDILYSGTIGAALEGALQGVKSIALSQHYTQQKAHDMFATARRHGAEAVRRALACPWERELFYNVNFPPSDTAKGFRLAPAGRRPAAQFGCEEVRAPNGRRYFWLAHRGADHSASPQADAALCAQGWITVTPLCARLQEAADSDAARRAVEGPAS